MDFEGSRLGEGFGDIFARRLLIGIEAEIVALHINLVNEFIVVRESKTFATVTRRAGTFGNWSGNGECNEPAHDRRFQTTPY